MLTSGKDTAITIITSYQLQSAELSLHKNEHRRSSRGLILIAEAFDPDKSRGRGLVAFIYVSISGDSIKF